MSSANDGGPAFPTRDPESRKKPGGLSIRDYFAGQALALDGEWFYSQGAQSLDAVASVAYELADAMLRAREAKP